MTIIPAAKARTVNVLVAIATATASGNAVVRSVHLNREDMVAAVRGNSGIAPAVGHPLPVTVAWNNARTGCVRRRENPVLTAKVRNVLPNIGPRPQQSRYHLFPKKNASRRCSIR